MAKATQSVTTGQPAPKASATETMQTDKTMQKTMQTGSETPAAILTTADHGIEQEASEQIVEGAAEQAAALKIPGIAAADIAKDQTLLGGYAYQIIRQQSKQIAKLRSQVLDDTDIEALHQMRISSRKLRSALTLFSDAIVIDKKKPTDSNKTSLKDSPNRVPACTENSATDKEKKDQTTKNQTTNDQVQLKLAKSLTKLTKALGKVRDLDVMQVWVAQALETDKQGNSAGFTSSLGKSEKKTLKALAKSLKKSRKKAFKNLKKFLKSPYYAKCAKRFKQWVKAPAFTPVAQQAAVKDAAERIIPPITKCLRHPGWLVGTSRRYGQIVPDQKLTLAKLNQRLTVEGELLHLLRKQIKQVRYQAEFFRGLYGITYAAQVREFRTLQKILGKLQDQIVISQFLSDELGKTWPKQLPTIYKAFQSSRLSHWQQWQPYQQKYLKLRCSLPSGTTVAR